MCVCFLCGSDWWPAHRCKHFSVRTNTEEHCELTEVVRVEFISLLLNPIPLFLTVLTCSVCFNNYWAVVWNLKARTHPDPRHCLDSLFVLSQRAHVRLFLEQRRIVVDVQHIDANPPSGFLPAAVSRQHGQREAAHQLVVQAGLQSDPASLLIQRKPERKMAAKLEPPDSNTGVLFNPCSHRIINTFDEFWQIFIAGDENNLLVTYFHLIDCTECFCSFLY